MRLSSDHGRSALFVFVTAIFLALVTSASAQSLGELNRRLNEIEPTVSRGLSNPQAASDAINQLDEAESEFAQIVEFAGL